MREYTSTLGPICPHCQHEHQADEPFYYESDEMDCNRCEERFTLRAFTETTWFTEAQNNPQGGEHAGE